MHVHHPHLFRYIYEALQNNLSFNITYIHGKTLNTIHISNNTLQNCCSKKVKHKLYINNTLTCFLYKLIDLTAMY